MDARKPTHPSYKELLALTVDGLEPTRAESVRDHLADCDACQAQFRELLRLPEAPPLPKMAIDDEEQDASWQQLAQTLRVGSPSYSPVSPPRLIRGGGDKASVLDRNQRPMRWLPMAAAVLLSGGLGLLLGRGGPTSDDVIDTVALTYFKPSDSVYRGQEKPPKKVSCPPPNGRFVWSFVPELGQGQTPKSVFVELRSNEKILASEWLGLTSEGTAELSLRRSAVPNGLYVISFRVDEKTAAFEEVKASVNCP